MLYNAFETMEDESTDIRKVLNDSRPTMKGDRRRKKKLDTFKKNLEVVRLEEKKVLYKKDLQNRI